LFCCPSRVELSWWVALLLVAWAGRGFSGDAYAPACFKEKTYEFRFSKKEPMSANKNKEAVMLIKEPCMACLIASSRAIKIRREAYKNINISPSLTLKSELEASNEKESCFFFTWNWTVREPIHSLSSNNVCRLSKAFSKRSRLRGQPASVVA
jgi:hypothetical protein